ncbi:isoprenyl transferase [Nanchangia anserum]|uniref:Isoprenyl transferase n=1 Tax=Nanchangia anserum TaxID=2692125 RepID=A0A8I0G8H0_9ACTO|nr:isoprenyl transferase [Nanchangia anserum]MBD3689084.1 isoprenyl transferase [Nanchangia anserum]QOX81322.1 isoprenyl transferase [Nanchangia anserum]
MDQHRHVPGPGAGTSTCPPLGKVPAHVALIMDGNGRWANARGLPRTEGHLAGEVALMDTIAGAIEAGVTALSVYAFSTENWRRSPAEVRFLMGYSRDVLRRRRDELDAWGVRVRWSGRPQRLWRSVIAELREAEERTRANTTLDLVMCVNYGGRAELVDAARALAREAADGAIKPERIGEKSLQRHLYVPDLPDVDLMVRTSGEQRTSNYLPWQAAYAELIFAPEPWPDYNRACLWRDIAAYGSRQRRFGGAVDAVEGQQGA